MQLADSNRRLRKGSPLLVLIIALIGTMIALDRPLIRGDGIAYLVWIDTLALDRDIRLDNQLDKIRAVNTYQIAFNPDTQRLVNIFPFGIAVFQAPFHLIGNLFASRGWLNVNPDYFAQMQGVGLPYSLWLMFGSNLMILVAALAAYAVGSRLCNAWLAALATYGLFLGTSLIYYSTITPLNSHLPGALALSVAMYLLARRLSLFLPSQSHGERIRGWRGTLEWALFGLMIGIMGLSRWQLLAVAPPLWILIAVRGHWRGLIIATLAAGVTLLPLPLVWNELFGSPFLVPFDTVGDSQFMGAGANRAWDVFLQTIRQSPLIGFALLGLIPLWPFDRGLSITIGAIVIIQLIVNGAALDWYAGNSYMMRRMSELYPLYVLAACGWFAWPRYWHSVTLRRRRIVRPIAVGLFAVGMAWSAVYLFSFLSFTWTNPRGIFVDEPAVMMGYFADQLNRWEVIGALFQTHIGPFAWGKPGP